ncbi:hypothetical protein BO97DRAFT_411929 [Aspergillus homomorphus CBS 101889]|uniref:Uncharacterized protein n=1 Tax=Aspergillus homomorphus (strain CBS 101889) TaxID=1450537 RepID=A0A395I4N4_ASPHC|nr:hypothetical protein BO97DRAFT_411929 [Aspergillus homomorphus CBS 101889]RAL15172.1 hypothetical protein BO97DRAFT_411929 [Aspergillus homomorphus CBS 101889]
MTNTTDCKHPMAEHATDQIFLARRDSLVVTHPTTNLPACGLSTAERTGSPVFHTLWSSKSYVHKHKLLLMIDGTSLELVAARGLIYAVKVLSTALFHLGLGIRKKANSRLPTLIDFDFENILESLYNGNCDRKSLIFVFSLYAKKSPDTQCST